ncbi:hypothetical protein IWW46_006425 [Coemansia sp. RSA 2440]|nr:hypothetical protein IWW46_006425 [Coemansia sp. RSA 2440]
MTVVIVGLLNGKTEDEWYEHIKTVAEESGLKSSPKIDRSGTDSDMPEDSSAIIKAIISQANQDSSDDDEVVSEHSAGAAVELPKADLADEPKPAEAKEEKPASK